MIKIKNKIIVVITLAVMFLSCERKFDFENYDVTLGNLFSGYGDDIEKDITFVNKQIQDKKSKIESSDKDVLDSINVVIESYYNYLNNIDIKSSELEENLFYNEDTLTKEGKKFKHRSEKFLSELDQLTENKDLKDYLKHFFNVDDIKHIDDSYFLYMEYHYLGIPYPTFKFLIKKRKYDLMMFQNELLNYYLISGNVPEVLF